MERIQVIDAVHQIVACIFNYEPSKELHPEMPTGPLNRVADNVLAKRVLDQNPK